LLFVYGLVSNPNTAAGWASGTVATPAQQKIFLSLTTLNTFTTKRKIFSATMPISLDITTHEKIFMTGLTTHNTYQIYFYQIPEAKPQKILYM